MFAQISQDRRLRFLLTISFSVIIRFPFFAGAPYASHQREKIFREVCPLGIREPFAFYLRGLFSHSLILPWQVAAADRGFLLPKKFTLGNLF